MLKTLLVSLLLVMLSGCWGTTPPVAVERTNPFLRIPVPAQTPPRTVDYLTPFNVIETDLEMQWSSTEEELENFFMPAKPMQ
jgi:hypothetical protein